MKAVGASEFDRATGTARRLGAKLHDEHDRKYVSGALPREVEQVCLIAEVPTHLVQLVVLVEDKRYWFHIGTDPIAIARALWVNAQGTGSLQGGSTIPEQLVKQTSGFKQRTVFARLLRSILAVWLVARSMKTSLLMEYLQTVYLGRGATGIRAGAKQYFGKESQELTPAESLFLVERIAMPASFRSARLRNILEREEVRSVLGSHIASLPDAYRIGLGGSKGQVASIDVRSLIEDLNAR